MAAALHPGVYFHQCEGQMVLLAWHKHYKSQSSACASKMVREALVYSDNHTDRCDALVVFHSTRSTMGMASQSH